jgi:hypothetical protein
MSFLCKIKNPIMFQGHLRKKQYFEGWFYKLVDAQESNIYAIIPGISFDHRRQSSHCFIQVLNGITGRTDYVAYPLSEFHSSAKSFHIRIGGSTFTADSLRLDIANPDIRVSGEVKFDNRVTWPFRWQAPGVMGWYSYVPFMECYHGLISMNHSLQGSLKVDHQKIDFTGGKGYGEKDWGSSFPEGYVWMQSNHFTDDSLSFMASVAKIPWLATSFIGFIVFLWHDGVWYPFTTYTGAKLTSLHITSEAVEMVVMDKRHRLEILALRHEKAGFRRGEGLLRAPVKGAMVARVLETHTSRIHLKLYALKEGGIQHPPLLSDEGRHAGLEMKMTEVLSRATPERTRFSLKMPQREQFESHLPCP